MKVLTLFKYFEVQVMLMHFLLCGFSIEIINAHAEDADLSIKEIVEHHGYLFESHEVITEDGYILTLHRIPGRNLEKVWNFPKDEQKYKTSEIGSPLFI